MDTDREADRNRGHGQRNHRDTDREATGTRTEKPQGHG
jgi:hypothetical protein